MRHHIRYAIFAITFLLFGAIGVRHLACDGSGEATFRDDAKTWYRTPITVYAKDYSEATVSAVALWNRAAGCEVLKLVRSETSADIVVKATDGTPCGVVNAPGMLPDHAGGAYIQGGCAEVHVAYPGDLRMQLVIVAHEIGHLLGLADDPDGCWIMRGSVVPVYDCQTLRASDADARALKSTYCKP